MSHPSKQRASTVLTSCFNFLTIEKYTDCVEEFDDDDEEDEEDGTEANKALTTKKKKKVKVSNYGKIAAALGKMQTAGISVAPPDINKSTFTFSPDVENSIIRFGMNGITKVGQDIVKQLYFYKSKNYLDSLYRKSFLFKKFYA